MVDEGLSTNKALTKLVCASVRLISSYRKETKLRDVRAARKQLLGRLTREIPTLQPLMRA